MDATLNATPDPTPPPAVTRLTRGHLSSLKLSLATALIELSARSEVARQVGDTRRAGDLAQQAIALTREAWRLRRIERDPGAMPAATLRRLTREARRHSADLVGAEDTLAGSARLVALLTQLSEIRE